MWWLHNWTPWYRQPPHQHNPTSLVTDQDDSNQKCQDDLASFSHQPVWSSQSQYHGGIWMVCPIQHAPATCFQVWGWIWGGSAIFTIQVPRGHWFHHIYIVEGIQHLVFVLEIKPHPNLVNKSRHSCLKALWEPSVSSRDKNLLKFLAHKTRRESKTKLVYLETR